MAMLLDDDIYSYSNQDCGNGKFLKDDNLIKYIKDFDKEIKDPDNLIQYEREVKLYESERGVDVEFLDSLPGFALKAKQSGFCQSYVFINVAINDKIEKPTLTPTGKGLKWRVPHAVLPLRRELGLDDVIAKLHKLLPKKEKQSVIREIKLQGLWVYDVIVNPSLVESFSQNDSVKNSFFEVVKETVKKYYKKELQNISFLSFDCYLGIPQLSLLKTIFDQEAFDESKNDLLKYPNRSTDTTEEKIQRNGYKGASVKSTVKPKMPEYKIKYINKASLQDYTTVNKNVCGTGKPERIGLTIKLPKVSRAADIDANVAGKTFVLTTTNAEKYELKVQLPYIVEEDPIKADFDLDSSVFVLEFATIKDVNVANAKNSSPVPSIDSGVDCENGYRTNSDVETSSVSSQDEFAECEKSDQIRTKDDSLSAKKYILPDCEFTQNDNYIFMKINSYKIQSLSFILNKIDDHQFFYKFMSIGQGLTPILYGGYVSIKPHNYKEMYSNIIDDKVFLKLKKSKKVKLEFLFMGISENPQEKYYFHGCGPKNNNFREIPKSLQVENCDEDVAKSGAVQKIKRSESLDIPSSRSFESSGVFTTSSYPKGILKGRSRCYSDSQVDCNYGSSPDYDDDDIIDEEEESDFASKKSVRFNEHVIKQLFASNASILEQQLKNQKKAASKKRNRERKLSEGSSDQSASEISNTEGDSDKSGSGNNKNSKKKSKNNKNKKGKNMNARGKSTKKKRITPNLSNHMIFQLDDS